MNLQCIITTCVSKSDMKPRNDPMVQRQLKQQQGQLFSRARHCTEQKQYRAVCFLAVLPSVDQQVGRSCHPVMLSAADAVVIAAIPLVAQGGSTLCSVVATICTASDVVTHSGELILCVDPLLLLGCLAAVGCHVQLVRKHHQLVLQQQQVSHFISRCQPAAANDLSWDRV